MLLNKSWPTDKGWLILTPPGLTTVACLKRVRAAQTTASGNNRARDQEAGLSLAFGLSPVHQHSWTCSQAAATELGCVCSQTMAKEVIQLSLTRNNGDLREVEIFCLCCEELKLLPIYFLLVLVTQIF